MNTKFKLLFDDIIGESSELKELKRKSDIIKNNDLPIIITGPTGSGKDLIARAIHFESNRRNHNFIPLNCAAIPDSIIESILFGYESGSFTGADPKGQKGEFELANEGTIFLDEIGDMSLKMQSVLLRILENKTFRRIGGSKTYHSDFRLISATNKELHKLVEENKFRKDLLYRINSIPLYVPALIDRKSDIPILSEYFLQKLNAKNNSNKYFSDKVIDVFYKYNWSGNIRELKNTINYAYIFSIHNSIELDDLPKRFRTMHRSSDKSGLQISSSEFENSKTEDNLTIKKISTLEKEEIKKALKIYNSDTLGLEKAAYDLDISISTLYRKIKRYNL